MNFYHFDDFSIGDEFITTYTISEEVARPYVELVGGTYVENQPVLPSVFLIYTPLFEAIGGRFVNGTVHLKQEASYYNKPKVGDQFTVKVTVKNKYVKKDKNYLIYETTYSLKDKLYCRLLSTQLVGLTS
ncbi:hypothetical protein ACJROX_13620 [Pseudalkalibacillus sp. A8]|uniref:hypothetical protein n=1 Tax=Pseudalkalibacillus sp. A8 TaxID=3382641 RepID=UPI0038B51EBB